VGFAERYCADYVCLLQEPGFAHVGQLLVIFDGVLIARVARCRWHARGMAREWQAEIGEDNWLPFRRMLRQLAIHAK
jgi:hypothetical protein